MWTVQSTNEAPSLALDHYRQAPPASKKRLLSSPSKTLIFQGSHPAFGTFQNDMVLTPTVSPDSRTHDH